MNIILYSHYFAPEIGAPSARIYDMGRQWLEQGHRVQIATCFPNHPTGEIYPGYQSRPYLREQLDGLDVHRHWTYVTANKGFIKKTLGHVSYLPSTYLLGSERISRPDIAIGTSPTFFAAMAAAGTGRRRDVPFIMEVRDLWPAIFVELGVLTNPLLIRLLEKLELSLYRQAAKIVTVTEAFRHNLIERGVPESKVHTIPNGADAEFWQPTPPPTELRRKLNLENKFVVLYIGAHGISQALKAVLESAKRLRDRPQIEFVFVGEGAEKEELVAQAQRQKIENVRFLDPVDKNAVKDFYALADACLVPLRDIPLFEIFIPSKMFEMMAMERPIIGSVRGESAAILRNSGGALVVEPEDSAAIAAAVVQLQENPGQAQEMGRRGRKFVQAKYSRRALAATYADVMREAIDQHARCSR